MIRLLAALGASLLTLFVLPATAAELLKPNPLTAHQCPPVWRCGPSGCAWHRECLRGCPDGNSCYPLFGAYGPYGGLAYWGAYSYNVWDYYPPIGK
jgi:hypothetical protein